MCGPWNQKRLRTPGIDCSFLAVRRCTKEKQETLVILFDNFIHISNKRNSNTNSPLRPSLFNLPGSS